MDSNILPQVWAILHVRMASQSGKSNLFNSQHYPLLTGTVCPKLALGPLNCYRTAVEVGKSCSWSERKWQDMNLHPTSSTTVPQDGQVSFSICFIAPLKILSFLFFIFLGLWLYQTFKSKSYLIQQIAV